MNRRDFLKLGPAAMAPFLLPRVGRAGGGTGPKRLIVFHTSQGTVLPQFVPTGSETSFTLPHVTAPLAPFQDRMLLLTGLDNRQPRYNQGVGDAHSNANYTVFTGQPYGVFDPNALTVAGPTFEQVVADRIGTSTAYQRIDLVSGGWVSNGVTPCSRFFYGPYDRVSGYNDPYVAILRLFGDTTLTPEEAAALRDRRVSVLDRVMGQFGAFRDRLPVAERERLDLHEERVRQLEARISGGLGQCTPPSFTAPAGYDAEYHDDVTAPAMIDIGVAALACDYTRVLTLEMANSHGHAFEWLWARNGGSPIVDTGQFDNWHAMVHADYQPGMEHVYRWYMELFAQLLTQLDAEVDADGDNLLDTSMVLWMSEFSRGRHWNNALPAIVAGNFGGAQLGRWLDYMGGSVDQFIAANNYMDASATTNQLYTSILQAFGQPDTGFGNETGDMPTGVLPGLFP